MLDSKSFQFIHRHLCNHNHPFHLTRSSSLISLWFFPFGKESSLPDFHSFLLREIAPPIPNNNNNNKHFHFQTIQFDHILHFINPYNTIQPLAQTKQNNCFLDIQVRQQK